MADTSNKQVACILQDIRGGRTVHINPSGAALLEAYISKLEAERDALAEWVRVLEEGAVSKEDVERAARAIYERYQRIIAWDDLPEWNKTENRQMASTAFRSLGLTVEG